MPSSVLLLLGLLCGGILPEVYGHGRLLSPPGRPTMWRFNFKSEIDYDDNQLFCGGFDRQWYKNKGKCGICGDPWDEPAPRENEDGGRFGRGIVVERYTEGQDVFINVEITAHHMGYFEFRVCPITSENQVPDQECLDKYLLEQADGQGPRYYLPQLYQVGSFPVKMRLPAGLTCQRCVLQWHYHTGNRWGECKDGVGRMGCGPQETFRGCADIAIDPATTNGSIIATKEPVEHKENNVKPVEEAQKPSIPEKQDYEAKSAANCKLPETMKKLLNKK